MNVLKCHRAFFLVGRHEKKRSRSSDFPVPTEPCSIRPFGLWISRAAVCEGRMGVSARLERRFGGFTKENREVLRGDVELAGLEMPFFS